MAQNLDNFDEALKIDYLPVVREQLNNANVLSSKVRRNERDVSGKRWQLTTHIGRTSGIGSGTETGLPTAGNQEYLNPYGFVKYTRGRIQVSGPTIAASRDDKGAMVRALESEMKYITEDLKREVNYQWFNDGSAVRALVNGDPGTEVTLTLDAPGTRWLQEGMLIDFLDPSAGTTRTPTSGTKISSISSNTAAKTSVANVAGVADNDWIIRKGARAGATNAASDSYEMMGLKGIIDDGTYVTILENISRSVNPVFPDCMLKSRIVCRP